MDENKLLGGLLAMTGVADMLVARYLGTKLPPIAQTLLLVFGAGFIVLGSLLGFGVLRVI